MLRRFRSVSGRNSVNWLDRKHPASTAFGQGNLVCFARIKTAPKVAGSDGLGCVNDSRDFTPRRSGLCVTKSLVLRGSHGHANCADPLYHDFNHHPGFDGPGTYRRTTRDQITGIERHVLREATDDLLRREDHV